jgi:hypothetical protein
MARPVVNPIAERIYEEIAPVTVFDEENDWALLHFIHAWTNAMMAVEEVARDTDEGPGWSSVLDPDRAPAMFLDFLSALVGSRGYKGEPDDHKRIRINGMTGLRRGSSQAMRAAASISSSMSALVAHGDSTSERWTARRPTRRRFSPNSRVRSPLAS